MDKSAHLITGLTKENPMKFMKYLARRIIGPGKVIPEITIWGMKYPSLEEAIVAFHKHADSLSNDNHENEEQFNQFLANYTMSQIADMDRVLELIHSSDTKSK